MTHLLKTAFFVCLLILSSCEKEKYPGPLTPEEALENFELRDGFSVEIFAAEPHVMDPVEMVFDEQGNAFVAEMPDYPFMPENGKGAGRIRVLQDTDGDGRIDKNVIFADSILEATSMLLITRVAYVSSFGLLFDPGSVLPDLVYGVGDDLHISLVT